MTGPASVPDLALPPSSTRLPTPPPAPAPKLGLDLGPASTRMHVGQEIELEGDQTSIPLAVQPDLVRPPRMRRPVARPAPPPKRSLAVPLVFLLLLGGAGASLEATRHGAFFRRDLDLFLKREAHALLEQDTYQAVHAAFAFDTWDHAVAGLAVLDETLEKTPDRKGLAGFAAWAFFAYEQRFGPDAKRHAQATALLARAEGPWVGLARAMRDVLARDPAKAMASAKAAADSANPEAHLVLAFACQLSGQSQEAIAALDRAVAAEQSARTRGALVRALEPMDPKRAKESAGLLVDVAESHVSSRLVLARLAMQAKDGASLQQRLGELMKLGASASPSEKEELDRIRRLADKPNKPQ